MYECSIGGKHVKEGHEVVWLQIVPRKVQLFKILGLHHERCYPRQRIATDLHLNESEVAKGHCFIHDEVDKIGNDFGICHTVY